MLYRIIVIPSINKLIKVLPLPVTELSHIVEIDIISMAIDTIRSTGMARAKKA